MTEVGIRPALETDVDAITAIYNEAVVNTTASWDDSSVSRQSRLEWLRANTSGRNVTLVAEIGGRVVGFASYGAFRTKAGYDETVEHTVYLSPESRGYGLGSRLLGALIEAARLRGIHVMVGALSHENEASLRLHQTLGFVEVARMPEVGKKFGRWLDLVLVQLVLDDRRRPGDPIPTD